VTTLQAVELGVLGPLWVRQDGAPVAIPGAKPRAILTMLGLHHGSVVSADTLVELLWREDPPRTAAKALQTHISSLRRALGDGFVLTQGTGWALADSEVDASRYKSAARLGRDAAATGDISQAVVRFEEALALWRGIPELPDGRQGTSEKTRWIEGHAALVEDRADALLATAHAAEIIGELEAAVAEAPLRERRWGQLMLALYRAGRQGDALGAYQRARTMLADELGIDPGPELRRLETAIVAQHASLDVVVAQQHPSVMRAVTFLLTDIEGSTAAWEADAAAMAVALARHDELVEQVVMSRGGRLIKTRGEGDATFSVFERPSAAAAAAMELQEAVTQEEWNLREPMRIRIALHTGEVELRDGDYFGRAVNRAARLRSLAIGGQILCSGATAELVIDSLPDDVVLADMGLRELRNLARPEHVFELRPETAEESAQPPTSEAPMERPGLPSVLIGTGPFVGRESELERLLSAWQTSLGGGACAALIAGEPGVGKTRLAGEWSRQAYEQGAVVLYGRCDEDLGAPYQPFAEALRSMVPCVGTSRLRGLRGVEALLPLVPGLVDEVPDLAAPTRADPDTERYALFDAVVALLEMASTEAPVVLVLDDLHWAAKPTLLLLRHLLRFGDRARLQIVGTYRSTDLDRSHPLAAMLADLHRDGTANRISLSGLDEDDVSAYVAKAGYDDEELGHALASVTGGNPFFLIEALRHVDESGGVWDPSTLPQGVREAVSRRLTRLPIETNKALAAAAVVGSRFALDLVERVVGDDLVDAFDEAAKAGIVIEEPGGRYRFNHAIVRQSLLAELPSMRRMRLHQRIAATLEDEPGADDELLAELAHHYFECAWAGNAAKAVEYCRRAADQAMARLAYEGAADLYDHALHALDEIDDELPDRDDQVADLLVARCEALLAAGDVASAAGAVSQLQQATVDSARLSAWATCFDGQLSVLVHPERLDDVEAALGAAAHKLAEIDDAAGEAKAHTVRATCLARLGRVGDCEIALDDALTAARRAREHRRVNAVLASAPLAALWGPNPVPRAGGRCLDVVRLLRITTDSPAVEATSTRCQAVLEAFRGRDAAARRMIDSARRTVTELGLRHALLEVEQFAGIVELVLDDPAAAEPHLRQACNGFRRMGLDADTAETAALLGRACLALNREAEADELCTESERLAGHALKPAIAWRTLRAQLLSRGNDHDEARRVAQAAITLAERTDALVDHGDACLALATVLGTAGDAAGARSAAERAASLYERKGAAALADKARGILGERAVAPAPASPEVPSVEPDNACVRAGERVMAAVERQAWDEVEQLFASTITVESRRKIVGFGPRHLPSQQWPDEMGRYLKLGLVRYQLAIVAVRGERLALIRLAAGTAESGPGAPQDEMLQLIGLDEEGRIARQVWFDLDDADAAIAEIDATYARFEKTRRKARRPENAASRLYERFKVCFAARDWGAIAEMNSENLLCEDRRRVVNSGLRHGRDALIAELSAIAEAGVDLTSDVIATRGEHLVLSRVQGSGQGQGPDAFYVATFDVIELDADERAVARIIFDLDDFDAAVAELDVRYIAGEAAAHAQTWSVIVRAYWSLIRHELPPTTPDWVNLDHRRGIAFEEGAFTAYLRDILGREQLITNYIEAVHRLNNLGAVFTQVFNLSSQEGFDGEWRIVALMTVEGDLVSRAELFDEADLDTAIARFEQLSCTARRLGNTASQIADRFLAHFAAGNWDAMAEVLADNLSNEDRRRVVNGGVRHGRDAQIADMRATAELWTTSVTSTVMAVRGKNLVLTRNGFSSGDNGPDNFLSEIYTVGEIDADERIVSIVTFDLDDFDSAIAELDARYLAGEAAAHARTWSAISGSYAAINRHELPLTTPDCVNIDRRREIAMGVGDLIAYIGAGPDRDQDYRVYVEAVHRLTDPGAVVTYAAYETSQEGFDAEWRGTAVLTVEGDMVSRTEVFDEADLDTAFGCFDELSRPAPQLENTASLVTERFQAHFAARDWAALREILAEGFSSEDRRHLGAGVRHGRDAQVANVRAIAELWSTNVTRSVVATRGADLVLVRITFSRSDEGAEAFLAEVLMIAEIDADEKLASMVTFDLDDFDAAIAELDVRYLTGEAAAIQRLGWQLQRYTPRLIALRCPRPLQTW
jgi:DNA-binding SARP family transcriptional activator